MTPETPILLSATCTVSNGSTAGPNAIALRNTTGKAIELREIRFAQRNHADLSDISTGRTTTQALTARITINGFPLTDGSVPIGVMGTHEELLNSEEGCGDLSSTDDYQYRDKVFKLPAAMWIPPGADVQVSFDHLATIEYNIFSRISLVGNTTDKKPPKMVHVPFVTSYSSKAFIMSAADTDESPESALRNPFDAPLHIDRLQVWSVTNAQTTAGASGIRFSTADPNDPDFLSRMAKITMTDSRGHPIVREFTTSLALFPMDRVWRCPHDMPPNAYYKVFVDVISAVGGYATNVPYTQLIMSAIGWRDVPTNDVRKGI